MSNERDLAFIASALSLKPEDTVLEIGPGTGTLTKRLLARACRVVAVEKDADMVSHLRQNFWEPNLEVIPGDILQFGIQDALKPGAPVKVVGNIPYNITSPIIEWLIASRKIVSEAVLTVQWEVARRLAAQPGGRDWGSLSVFLQFYADVRFLKKIDKSHFHPAPKVDSGVLRIIFLNKPRFPLTRETHFFGLVRRAFQKCRKTLLNALADKEDMEPSKKGLLAAFSACRIDPKRRPETLTLREWADLSESLGSPGQK